MLTLEVDLEVDQRSGYAVLWLPLVVASFTLVVALKVVPPWSTGDGQHMH